jgi:hypothetical protein
MKIGRMLGNARKALARSLLLLFLITHAEVVAGQEPRGDQGCILSSEFVEKLADRGLSWPGREAIEAAAARDATEARYDTCRWQEIVLTQPFAAARFKGRPAREEGAEFTAAQGADGYDSIFHRWETAEYRLQLRCAQWLLSVMVEPKSSAPRPALSGQEVAERTREMVRRTVKCGPELLANSTLRLAPTAYGFRASFEITSAQAEALRQATKGCNEGVGQDWLALLAVRTDGYSFVLDVIKIGARSPLKPVTTTQPGEKTWFKERKAGPEPSP